MTLPNSAEAFDLIERAYDLNDAQALILSAARQAWERWRMIADELDATGVMIEGRYANTPRLNPLIGAEAQARAAAIRALRALNLEKLFKAQDDDDDGLID